MLMQYQRILAVSEILQDLIYLISSLCSVVTYSCPQGKYYSDRFSYCCFSSELVYIV